MMMEKQLNNEKGPREIDLFNVTLQNDKYLMQRTDASFNFHQKHYFGFFPTDPSTTPQTPIELTYEEVLLLLERDRIEVTNGATNQKITFQDVIEHITIKTEKD